MNKIFTLLVLSILCSASLLALGPLGGVMGTCVGSTAYVYETDTTLIGTWSSSNTAVATIATSYGSSAAIMGVSAGTAIITYTYGGSYVTASFTVSPAPAPIAGVDSICAGTTTTLSDAVPGGVWSSSAPYYASVGSSSGVVSALIGGWATIYYTMGTGCIASTTFTVLSTYTGGIIGPSSVCLGSAITLISTDSMTAGSWSSSNTSIATVGTGGVVTGIGTGVVTISYTVSGICGTGSATKSVTVTTSPATIYGPASINIGSTALFNGSIPGGTWTSGAPSIATIGSVSGLATGVSLGTDVITYTVSGCGGLANSTATVNIVAFDGISGHVLFSGTPYYGGVKVWLIHFNPATNLLTAIDSTIVYSSGSNAYYQFLGLSTDSFRIKAAPAFDSLGTGYIPTYHTSNFYWHDATVLWHTSGTYNINQDINMAYGTTTSGPGFIAGDVTTGANKGTSGTVPSVNMHVCLVNAATLQIIQETHTNSTGYYSFSNLPVGQTYYIFPDSLNYLTTPYSAISLTTSSYSFSSASFGQHTLSKTILPVTSGIKGLSPGLTSLNTFPNPTHSKLNIQWNESANEKAAVSITDITGREVLNATLNMTQGSGTTQLDLSGLLNGIYMISVKSATLNYINKIELQK